MAAAYREFAWTRTDVRVSTDTINAALRAADDTAAVVRLDGDRLTVKSSHAWTAGRVQAAQTILDTVVEQTPQQSAQRRVDTLPIEYRALVLTLIDQINLLRAALPAPLPQITPAQAIAALRAKAGTL